ncbi:MAG: DNA methyltransferase [bacterium]|jgi:DNA modification methylase/predicted RNA-binding Zn-ribbon protein involved in translation (DUF1610 family)
MVDGNKRFGHGQPPLAALLATVKGREGFPQGRDSDILALSDPPFYTLCPNPYLDDFIAAFGRPYNSEVDDYQIPPFVGDVSEGKRGAVYSLHSYHTKIPYKAIMKYIEHYTEAGDIVFDGFCGSGMTGVAAQQLKRRAILSDLSPIATLIAYNYNNAIDIEAFAGEASRILQEVEQECNWMYATIHSDGQTKGQINYTVWSDVFICPYCQQEYVFWTAAVDQESGRIKNKYHCPWCGRYITKRECSHSTVSFFDQALERRVFFSKQVPVLINYTVAGTCWEKEPDDFDWELLRIIERQAIPYWFPADPLPHGHSTEQPRCSHGITHVHHFYTKRNLWVLAAVYAKIKDSSLNKKDKSMLLTVMTGGLLGLTKLQRFRPQTTFPNMVLSGTLYVGSLMREWNPYQWLSGKLKGIIKAKNALQYWGPNLIYCGSATEIPLRDNYIDYIFTDPPFGGNLMYSELNFLWEAWLKVFTNNHKEAIINKKQHKAVEDYKCLMVACLRELYRILKPNRWLTIVFHNSQAAVWNALQDALTEAGFIIAQVAVLDKKQGSFKQVAYPGAVKNDLVINAYKPKQYFTQEFINKEGKCLVSDFVAEHLIHLPLEPNIERTEQMLYSKMLAHYLQRGYSIDLDAKQFYQLLQDNFLCRNGHWYTFEESS